MLTLHAIRRDEHGRHTIVVGNEYEKCQAELASARAQLAERDALISRLVSAITDALAQWSEDDAA